MRRGRSILVRIADRRRADRCSVDERLDVQIRIRAARLDKQIHQHPCRIVGVGVGVGNRVRINSNLRALHEHAHTRPRRRLGRPARNDPENGAHRAVGVALAVPWGVSVRRAVTVAAVDDVVAEQSIPHNVIRAACNVGRRGEFGIVHHDAENCVHLAGADHGLAARAVAVAKYVNDLRSNPGRPVDHRNRFTITKIVRRVRDFHAAIHIVAAAVASRWRVPADAAKTKQLSACRLGIAARRSRGK